ncbi:alpha-tubulin N-acetyltransferase 1-like [Thalassophryne amazonica]|uniref:alpha-tubulin N-acetyltransferase 1-like n=1 Tax=Thalassophryne amazonica TaxID=390379 RepID=UPI00147242EF|nr:alpha-tubulin N-acetyltransferase 1-like [Thalassophryne amazonica]
MMEFPFDVNQLFPDRVSVLDQNLVAGRRSVGRPDLQAQIAMVIDELGKASAKAQQLTAPVTSASKLQSNSHLLYLLKDGERNGGRGVVVGFLKVGYKKLFLLNQQGVHVEAEPLCVLDFYVMENLQRHGYGLALFDFMLQHKNVDPVIMAYDRPSPKFLSFLEKHYCLTQSVPQVNNFVVFEGFFISRLASQVRKVPQKRPDGEIKPYSLMEREAVHQEQRALPWPFAPPLSPQRSASSLCSHPLSVRSSFSRAPPRGASAPVCGNSREHSPESPHIDRCRERRTSQHGLCARSSLYSRHMDSTAIGLLGRQLSDLRPVEDQSYALGHTDTHKLPNIYTRQSRSQHLLRLPAPKDTICSQTSLDRPEADQNRGAEACRENTRLLDSPECPAGRSLRTFQEKESDGSVRGWSWTVGDNCGTAQWVRQKQLCRSTRPW